MNQACTSSFPAGGDQFLARGFGRFWPRCDVYLSASDSSSVYSKGRDGRYLATGACVLMLSGEMDGASVVLDVSTGIPLFDYCATESIDHTEARCIN